MSELQTFGLVVIAVFIIIAVAGILWSRGGVLRGRK